MPESVKCSDLWQFHQPDSEREFHVLEPGGRGGQSEDRRGCRTRVRTRDGQGCQGTVRNSQEQTVTVKEQQETVRDSQELSGTVKDSGGTAGDGQEQSWTVRRKRTGNIYQDGQVSG